jgi:hypothetical protein
VLAGLAVQEAQLLEGLAENVFAAHFVLERCARYWFRRREGVCENLEQMNLSMAARVIREVSESSPCYARQKLPPERRRSLKL